MVGNRRETRESTSQTSVKWRKPAGDGTPFLVIQAIGKKSSLRLTCISRLEKATWKIGTGAPPRIAVHQSADFPPFARDARSEEHTSELQSHLNLVCRLLLEKKKNVNRSVSFDH